jgi:glutamate racemase
VLGVYDSGLGGLTVLAALRAAGIDQDIVYFADQAHNPYGEKSDAEISGFLADNLRVLAERRIDAVIAACNTTCAVAGRLGWPPSAFPILDLIATAGGAFAATPFRRIAVVATAATVRSGAYARTIGAAAPHAAVYEIAAPRLVPIVEHGQADTDVARDAVAEIVAELPPDIDALVYGCSHYPLLDRWFAAALGPGIARVNPAGAQAAATVKLIARLGLAPGTATTTYYTNDDPVAFAAAIRRWTGDPTGNVAAIPLILSG